MNNWFDRLFNQHHFVRRLLAVWAICLITWVVVQVFVDISQINSAVNTALGIIVGILTTVITHYQWSRNREDENAKLDNN